MTNQLKAKGKTSTWGVAQQKSFDKIKIALATMPILSIVTLQNLLQPKPMQVIKQLVPFYYKRVSQLLLSVKSLTKPNNIIPSTREKSMQLFMHLRSRGIICIEHSLRLCLTMKV